MIGEFLEAKFPFLRDDIFLVAQVHAKTGVQRLIMQKIELATGRIELEDALDCIHTVVGTIPQEEFEEITNAKDFPEQVLHIRSSEQLKEIHLAPEEKFVAFRSWVAGIAEAGLGAFQLLSDIETEGKLAYPIVNRLMAFAAKVDAEILLDYLEGVTRACQHEGVLHNPSLVANLIPLLQYALDYHNTLVMDAIFQLDLLFETFLQVAAGLSDNPIGALREPWEHARLVDAIREYAFTHFDAPNFVDTLRTIRRVIADGCIVDVLVSIGVPVPNLLELITRLAKKETTFGSAVWDNARFLDTLRVYGTAHFDAPTFIDTVHTIRTIIGNDRIVDLLVSIGMPVPTLLELISQLGGEQTGYFHDAAHNAHLLDALRAYGTTRFDTPNFIDTLRTIRRIFADNGVVEVLVSIGMPVPNLLNFLAQLAEEDSSIIAAVGRNSRFLKVLHDYGIAHQNDSSFKTPLKSFCQSCAEDKIWQVILATGLSIPVLLEMIGGTKQEVIDSFIKAAGQDVKFLELLQNYSARNRENPTFIEQIRVLASGPFNYWVRINNWVTQIIKNLNLPLYRDARLDPLEAAALWDLETVIGEPLLNANAKPLDPYEPGFSANGGHVTALSLSKKRLVRLPNALKQLPYLKKFCLVNGHLESLEGIGYFQSLEVLSLWNARLPSIPEEIGNLTNLRELSLGWNPLTSIPEVIGNLPMLQVLHLGGMKLVTFPVFICNLKSLRKLDLQENQLVTLPDAFGNLQMLCELNLEKNQLATLPECVTQLRSLQKLLLKENRLVSLPESISNLQSLQTLDISSNQLMVLPESISSLVSLQWLDLSHNRVRVLSEHIGNLVALHRLRIEDNHLKTLPESIVNLISLEVFWLYHNAHLVISDAVKRWIDLLQEQKCNVVVHGTRDPLNRENIHGWDDLGNDREREGDLIGAIEAYEEAVALDPEFIAAWIHLAKARREKGDISGIKTTFKLMTEKVPKNPDAWAALGKYCSAHKDWSEAAQAWEHVIALTGSIAAPEQTLSVKPQNSSLGVNLRTARQPQIEPTLAWTSLGTARFNLKDFKGAVEAYENAIALDPKATDAWFNLGAARFNLKDFKGAVEAYEKVNALDPNYSMAWTNLGAARVNLKDFKGAVEAFEKAIALDPKNSLAWTNLGSSRLFNLKDFKGAVEAFEHALQIDPKYEGAWVNLGYARAKLQNYSGAVEAAKHVLELNPANFSAWINLGVSLSSLGDFPGALQAAMHAAELDPKNPLPWINIGHARGKTNDLSGAVEASERAVQLDPKHPLAWSNLGYFQAKSGNLAKAAEAASQALKIDPTSAPAWDCSGYVHFKQGDLGAATAACLKSIKLDPHQTNAWVTLGQIRHAEGNFRAEIRAFERAVQLNPQEGEAWDHLGTAYDAAGRAGEALYCWELAARLSVPGSETRATEKRATGVHPLPVVFPPKH